MTARHLAEGAWFALEQAGLLLRDAALLYEHQRYASAAGLALLSREELGKSRVLLRFIERGEEGNLSTKQIRDELEKHGLKQRASIATVTTAVDDRLWHAELFADPENGETKAAQREVDDLAERIAKRLPDRRIQLRESPFYVDLGEGKWIRPVSLPEPEVSTVLWEANYDYSVFAGLVKNSQEFKWLRDLLEGWANRPDLPAPPLSSLGFGT